MACRHRDQLNPVVTSGIYQAGAEPSRPRLRAPAGVTNAIFIGQQVLPILKAPGALVTADSLPGR